MKFRLEHLEASETGCRSVSLAHFWFSTSSADFPGLSSKWYDLGATSNLEQPPSLSGNAVFRWMCFNGLLVLANAIDKTPRLASQGCSLSDGLQMLRPLGNNRTITVSMTATTLPLTLSLSLNNNNFTASSRSATLPTTLHATSTHGQHDGVA